MALINLRNALMSGKRLPYDAEVEYLTSTGTQYIDTGIFAKSLDAYDCTVWLERESGSLAFFGAANDAGRKSTVWATCGGAVRFGGSATITFVPGTWKIQEWNRLQSSYAQATLNGATRTATPSSPFDDSASTETVWIFKCHSFSSATFPVRMASFKWYRNGALIFDGIPVRKGTVGYLYDRVSGKLFGNAGTGDFVLGPDVVPVEYIESHGTEYINTGIILNDTYGIDINFAPMETASGVSEHGIFGSSVSGSGIRHNVLQIHSSAGGVGLWMPSNTRICNYAITIGEYQHWQINLNDSDEVVIDNVLKAHTHPTTPAECQYPVYLFGRNVANTLKSGSCSKMRLATWMVCDGSGNFIQKGLPVRVGTDATSWEGAMMDTLTRRIYRNVGTGAFAYGNDLKYPIPAA